MILNGDLIFLRRLESSLGLMLEKNELFSAQAVRESKYIAKAIRYAQDVNDSEILRNKERSIIKELLLELEGAYKDCTTSLGEKKEYLCDSVSDSGYEEELIVLKLRIRERLLPAIRTMLSQSQLIIEEKPKEQAGQGKTESKEQTEKSNDAWIKVTEAASLAGVNPGTITRWANNGDIQDNGKRGKERKVLKSSVLLKKAKREDDDRRKDTDEVLKDIANNIPDKH